MDLHIIDTDPSSRATISGSQFVLNAVLHNKVTAAAPPKRYDLILFPWPIKIFFEDDSVGSSLLYTVCCTSYTHLPLLLIISLSSWIIFAPALSHASPWCSSFSWDTSWKDTRAWVVYAWAWIGMSPLLKWGKKDQPVERIFHRVGTRCRRHRSRDPFRWRKRYLRIPFSWWWKRKDVFIKRSLWCLWMLQNCRVFFSATPLIPST